MKNKKINGKYEKIKEINKTAMFQFIFDGAGFWLWFQEEPANQPANQPAS